MNATELMWGQGVLCNFLAEISLIWFVTWAFKYSFIFSLAIHETVTFAPFGLLDVKPFFSSEDFLHFILLPSPATSTYYHGKSWNVFTFQKATHSVGPSFDNFHLADKKKQNKTIPTILQSFWNWMCSFELLSLIFPEVCVLRGDKGKKNQSDSESPRKEILWEAS